MPFKQKAKKNKEGSSSSAPARRDLASRYKAPFPIYTMEEGERFTRLAKCNFTGFPRNGFASKPKGWNATSVWEMLTGQSSFTPQNGKQVDIAGTVLDTIYNASRHQGKAQPTDIFRYMDGAFLKNTGLVEEVKTGNTVMYRWKSWERRVGQSDPDEGTSHTQMQRQRKGKAPVTSSSQAEEGEDEVAGWKQVLSKVEALQQSHETLQVTVFDMGQQLHKIQKNHASMERKWMKYFQKQNIEFTPSPPGSPEA
ncbi:hypothetical protein JCGZ_02437 [Jatropha curcas]|uniref:Uncharacterized protein n=1 Tax=Jatropha curcas TaxID=180498 RepID=A0A067LEU2_JATCU|nr:hypothetical protein JCGZ_02437 [Jatropha curcas]